MTKKYVEQKYTKERNELIKDIEQQIADLNKMKANLENGYTIGEFEVGALGDVAMRRYVRFKAQEELLSCYDDINNA